MECFKVFEDGLSDLEVGAPAFAVEPPDLYPRRGQRHDSVVEAAACRSHRLHELGVLGTQDERPRRVVGAVARVDHDAFGLAALGRHSERVHDQCRRIRRVGCSACDPPRARVVDQCAVDPAHVGWSLVISVSQNRLGSVPATPRSTDPLRSRSSGSCACVARQPGQAEATHHQLGSPAHDGHLSA